MKINLDNALVERARQAAKTNGYSSVDELIQHAVESELKRLEAADAERQVHDQLRGLGYVE
jgi:metal-responsive CopG/Arc/MetJ family transcriptional regulator